MSFSFKLPQVLANLLPAAAGTDATDVATHAVAALVGGAALSAYNTAAQTAVRSLITELDNGVDELGAAFDKFQTDNPLVQRAMTLGLDILHAQGLTLPTEGQFRVHVKAAITDVAAAFGFDDSGDVTTATATSVAQATPATTTDLSSASSTPPVSSTDPVAASAAGGTTAAIPVATTDGTVPATTTADSAVVTPVATAAVIP